MRFLITAAGSGPSVSVIKAIKRSRLTASAFVLATDMSPDSAGLFLADKSAVTPAVTHPEYPEVLVDLCERHGVDLLIPILDLEVPVIGSMKASLEGKGIKVAIDPPTVTTVALDKDQAVRRCTEIGIQVPPTWARRSEVPPDRYPIIGKPRKGTGARGHVRLDDPTHVPPVTFSEDDVIWQQFVGGNEFSIDMWGRPESSLFTAVPRWRRRIRDGQMVFGETVDDADLLDFARSVALAFEITEVSCLQVIRDARGEIFFVELNPRYGTGVSLSIAAGVHFPALQWFASHDPGRLEAIPRDFKAGLKMIRYWEEYFYT